MSHDQYLFGDFSLTITEADFSERGLYECKCDDKVVNVKDVVIESECCYLFYPAGTYVYFLL